MVSTRVERGIVFSSDEHAETRRRARRWRRLSLLGGLTLVACFFLPAIKACNSDVIPAQGFVEAVGDVTSSGNPSWGGIADHLVMVLATFPAYLAGLLMATAALMRLLGRRRWKRIPEWALLAVVVGTAITLLVLFGYLVAKKGKEGLPPSDEYVAYLMYVVAPVVVLIYLPLARRRRDRLTFGVAFISLLWILCWFSGWVIFNFGDIRYGMWLSIAAAGLLLLATIGEARAVTGQSWHRTIWQLLTARLARSLEYRGRCPACEYFLYGLTEMRCPECGRLFTFEELGVTPEQMGFNDSHDPTGVKSQNLESSSAPPA